MVVRAQVDVLRWLYRSGWGSALLVIVLVAPLLGAFGLAFHGAVGTLLVASAVWTATFLFVALGARRSIARLESLSIGTAGLRWRESAGPVAIPWPTVTGIAALGTPKSPTVVRIEAERIVTVRLHLLRNRERFLGALKEYGSHAYRLDETAEQCVLSGVPGPRRMVVPAEKRPTAPEPASYRELSGPNGRVSIEPRRALLGWHTLLYVGIPALLAAAGIGAAWALFGHSRWAILPVGVVLLFAPLACVTASAIVAEWDWQRRLAAFLGRDVMCTPWSIRSDDGRRRLRFAAADLQDPYAGPHRHLEELDAEGLTLRSYQESMKPTDLVAPERAEVAVVDPARWEPRCFRGLPWGRGVEAPEPMEEPAVLLLHRTEEGVLLTRFAAGRRHAGDTLHETMAQAEAQITAELGIEQVAWRQVELDGPWSFWPVGAAISPKRFAARRIVHGL